MDTTTTAATRPMNTVVRPEAYEEVQIRSGDVPIVSARSATRSTSDSTREDRKIVRPSAPAHHGPGDPCARPRSGDDWHHWLCAGNVTRRGVSLMLHKGALLHDPKALLVGEGRYLRQLPFEVAASHPDAVAHLVREAAAHQTDLLDDQEVSS